MRRNQRKINKIKSQKKEAKIILTIITIILLIICIYTIKNISSLITETKLSKNKSRQVIAEETVLKNYRRKTNYFYTNIFRRHIMP